MKDQPIQIQMLAFSKAGHDRGDVFAVLKEEDDYFFLADGRTRLFDRPKKKKKKHVQVITHLPRELTEEQLYAKNDADLRRLLKVFRERT